MRILEIVTLGFCIVGLIVFLKELWDNRGS